MDNEKEILEEVEKLQKEYKTTLVDQEEEDFRLIDKIDSIIKLIFNDESKDIYTTLNPEALKKWNDNKLKRWIGNLKSKINLQNFPYFILLVIITAFLVSEALPFYADGEAITFKTYVKAILTEICFLFLAGFSTNTHAQTVSVNVLRVAIFCLMLFVITSEVVVRGTQDVSKITNLADRIERLEKQIETTERDIERFRKMDWPKNMTQSIRKRETLEKELHSLRERQEKEGASKELANIIEYKMYGKAAFRLIIIFVSVLITRRLWRF